MDHLLAQALRLFEQHFGGRPEIIARAPGRVNIIGEHTDYNDGFVLPMAIERYTYVLGRKRPDPIVQAHAANLGRTAQASLDTRVRNAAEPWMDYVVGVADELAKLELPLHGADIVITGDVPIGCGLSSSASLEMAALVLFETLGGFHLEGEQGPRLGQRVENLFLGLNTGVMDQFISRMGREGHALFLDCRSFEYDHIPVTFADATFIIANTGVARGLTASKYNERVAQCREALAMIAAAASPGATHLRDCDQAQLEHARNGMSDVVYRRARHVITENARTREACTAMRQGDPAALGALMNASDDSLRCDYEVTCPELDAMTAIARALPGCHGARMTGAGFGGCAILLVDAAASPEICRNLMQQYALQTGVQGEIIVSRPALGAVAL